MHGSLRDQYKTIASYERIIKAVWIRTPALEIWTLFTCTLAFYLMGFELWKSAVVGLLFFGSQLTSYRRYELSMLAKLFLFFGLGIWLGILPPIEKWKALYMPLFG